VYRNLLWSELKRHFKVTKKRVLCRYENKPAFLVVCKRGSCCACVCKGMLHKSNGWDQVLEVKKKLDTILLKLNESGRLLDLSDELLHTRRLMFRKISTSRSDHTF
jgi:hypothetical protein